MSYEGDPLRSDTFEKRHAAQHVEDALLELDNGVWTILVEEIYSGELTSLPWPLAVGDDVVVAVDSECLQVRDQPGLAAVPIDCLDDGTPVTISAGPTDRDGLTWWRMEGLGWVAGNWLRFPTE